jgi:hypothetical protein
MLTENIVKSIASKERNVMPYAARPITATAVTNWVHLDIKQVLGRSNI